MFSWSGSGSDGAQDTSSSVLLTRHGTDGSAAFFSERRLGNLARGHFICEEPSAASTVRCLVIVEM